MIKLRTEDIVKVYKKRKVVNQDSIDIEQGEIVGLLGPNGAGKTTTFYMIVGMIRIDLFQINSFQENLLITYLSNLNFSPK